MYQALAHLYDQYGKFECPKGLYDVFLDDRRKYGFDKKENVLDLGCGTGIFSLFMSQDGFQVTGIDVSQEMLKIAKSKNDTIKWILGDIRSFSTGEKYQTVTAFSAVFNHLSNQEELLLAFKNVRKHIAPQGSMFFTMDNYRSFKEIWGSGSRQLETPLGTILKLRNFDEDSGRAFIKNTLVTTDGSTEDSLFLQYFSENEVANCLKEAGFGQYYFHEANFETSKGSIKLICCSCIVDN